MMEWINEIIKANTDENGVINVDGASAEIKKQFPQYAVPKSQYNNVSDQLKDANKTIEDIKSQTKDLPEIQQQLAEQKQRTQEAEQELLDLTKTNAFKDAVRGKVNDIEFAMFKHGEIELDKDGNIKNIDKWLETYATEHPSQMVEQAPAEPELPTFFGSTPAKQGNNSTVPTVSFGEQMAQEALKQNPHLFGQ